MKINYQQAMAFLLATLAISGLLYLIPVAGIEGRRLFNTAAWPIITLIAYTMLTYSLVRVQYLRGFRLELTRILGLVAFICALYFMHLFAMDKIVELLKIGSFVLLLVLASNKTLWQAFGYFRNLFALIVAPSIVLYLLMMLSVPPFLGFEVPTHEGKIASGMQYGNYLMGYMIFNDGQSINRLSALFDEPGVVGTFAAFLLAATRFRLDVQNVIIFVAAVLSWSLAFFVLIAVYLFSVRPRLFLIFLLLFSVLLLLFSDNPLVQKMLIDRLMISDDGISGDNRTTLTFELKFIEFLFSDKIYFGSDKTVYELGYYISSWKSLIWDYGLVGLTSILGYLVMLFTFKIKRSVTKEANKDYWVYFVMFIASIYQRPNVIEVAPLFILAAGISYMIVERQNKLERSLLFL